MAGRWMLYGATGYTGTLTARLAAERGLAPIVAGRSQEKVDAIATALGFEGRAFSLDDADTTRAALADVDVVLHDAGPFSATSRPMIDACLATKTHYLDITGELSVFEATFARDAEARAAGITLISGAGLDVVPSDCLAAMVAAELPDAIEMDIALWGSGKPSAGTAKSMAEIVAFGGRERRAGQLVAVPLGASRQLPFVTRTRNVVQVPLGDLVTTWHATSIPDIRTWFAMPPSASRWVRTLGRVAPLLRRRVLLRPVQKVLEWRVRGPSDDVRAASRTEIRVEARNAAGDTVSATLMTPNGYSFTADCTLRAVERLLGGGVPVGAQAPSSAFGSDFVLSCDGVELQPFDKASPSR